ncbi:redoxin domain-containing protein [Streptomyces sp. GESEQ-4]|uniref:redoxin domain-containing protein n=1 Tax=Streptomyces sp. GESEQ-4 TaxID=2812655 RepID=UPI001B3355D1|nr:redoxin domain-containing protein [Streptomyces sp. GESEQ-4]
MPLEAELRAIFDNRHTRIPAEALEIMDRRSRELAESSQPDRAPTASDRAPAFCNLTLRALQHIHSDITAHGAQLVAVSPQIPDESLSLTEKHGLAFHVLSDLAFDLAALYDSFGFDLQRVNAGHARTLPLPATYVIDRAGTIRWAFVNTDYEKRAEPQDILGALSRYATS